MSRDDENATCETCRFWNEDMCGDDGSGECRILSPDEKDGELSEHARVFGCWLYTISSDWCGRHQYAKDAGSKPIAGDPLVSRWFHSFNDKGDMQWQGQVLGALPQESYLVQLFSWLDGAETDQQIVPFSSMSNWKFYDSDEDMTHEAGKVLKREYAKDAKKEEKGG